MSARHPAWPVPGRGGRKTPEALARLHSARSLNRSQGFTAGCRGSSLAPTGRRSFNEVLVMNWTALVLAGLTMAGSCFGSYLAVREMIARMDERLRASHERMDRHSNRLNRLEDRFIKSG